MNITAGTKVQFEIHDFTIGGHSVQTGTVKKVYGGSSPLVLITVDAPEKLIDPNLIYVRPVTTVKLRMYNLKAI